MNWYLKYKGVEVKIDPPDFPEADEVAFDVETLSTGEPYSIAICGGVNSVSVYFNFTPELFAYLRSRKLIAHQARADVRWLSPRGITMEHVSWDTMLADYVISSSQESYGLKELAYKWLSLQWPKMFSKTGDIKTVFIDMACDLDSSLMVTSTKTYKTKPPITTTKKPKKLLINQLPKILVANYNAWDAYATFMMKKSQLQRATPLAITYMQKIEFPCSALLYEVENKGIKVDRQRLLLVHKKFLKKMYRAKRLFSQYVGNGVLISSPVQVLKALRKIDCTIPSTDEDYLQPYRYYRQVKLLLAYRGFAKICNTYTKVLYKKSLKSPTSRVYCDFVQHTETGRLACRKPNLQNQPPELRACFIPEDGCLFINGDWSQIELRVPAHFSEEPLMMDTFINNKKKIHQVTADEAGVSYKVGKTINFLLTNSGGPKRLAAIAEIPLKKAIEAMDRFKGRFHVLFDWIEGEKVLARQKGGATTLYGRFVPIPELRSRDFKLKGYAERQALSVKVQGSAADMMKAAMIKLWRKYGLIPVVTVHDEIMLEIPINNVPIVQYQLKGVMESIVKLKVPLVADIGVGDSWATAKKKD